VPRRSPPGRHPSIHPANSEADFRAAFWATDSRKASLSLVSTATLWRARETATSSELETCHVALRFLAVQLLLSLSHLVDRVLDRVFILFDLRLKFGNFEHRHHLTGFDARAVIHI
jgi:hypothetical protein